MTLERVRDLCSEAGRLHRSGQTQVGLSLAEEALTQAADHLGRQHYGYALSLCTLGWLRHEAGEAATALFAEAVARARQLTAVDYEHAMVVLQHAAEYAGQVGASARQAAIGAELCTLHRQHLGADHPRTWRTLHRWQQPRP